MTELTQERMAPKPLALSLPELGYLLHLTPKSEQSLTRARLQLVAEPDDDVLRSGLSALAARGGVGIDHGTVRPSPENGVIAAVLGTAQRWVEIGFSAGANPASLHLVEGSGAILLVERAPLGVLEFTGVQPGVTLASAAMQICASLVGSAGFGSLIVNAIGISSAVSAVAGVAVGDRIQIRRWAGSDALAPGVVAATVMAAVPFGPGWDAVGAGPPADLLGWISMAVGPGEAGPGVPS